MHTLFVYGTLKRGCRSHRFLEEQNALFIKTARTVPKYHLYRLTWYPGMVIDELEEGGVEGEVFSVPDSCMERLDRYEGVPDLFVRHEVELEDGTTATAYLCRQNFDGSRKIANGKWTENGEEEAKD